MFVPVKTGASSQWAAGGLRTKVSKGRVVEIRSKVYLLRAGITPSPMIVSAQQNSLRESIRWIKRITPRRYGLLLSFRDSVHSNDISGPSKYRESKHVTCANTYFSMKSSSKEGKR